jgi:hypothetical protein
MRLAQALVAIGCGVGALAGTATPAGADTISFVGQGCQPWSVPLGVSSVQITATGSAGQTASGLGGTGDVVSGALSGLSAPQTLDVCVDSGGGPALPGSGGGGGASGVSRGSDFSNPVLIAGGGGGGGSFTGDGGGAGLPDGGAGGFPPFGGSGGTQSAGGSGGIADLSACSAAIAATLGVGSLPTPGLDGAGYTSDGPGSGGSGGIACDGQGGGGGGGGGYYGGGGGGGEFPGGYAGGGGSDFCSSLATLSGCQVTGTNSSFGSASVVITYSIVPTSKDQCKEGGWQKLTDNNGTPFKNQGDCVSYVASGGKNRANS